MPQQRIPLEPGRMYHIWTHANGSENLFREDENYRYFLDKYAYYIHPVAGTFAYCLMPNHLHLMVRIREEEEVLRFVRKSRKDLTLQGFETLGGLDRGGISNIISRRFSHLFNGYTQAYNKKYDRIGSLFTPNFKRKLIDTDEYFTRLITYIHHNPIHHGFVTDLNDWPYSSWKAYVFNKNSKVNNEEGMAWFGGRQTFMEIHRELKPEKLKSIFEE